MEMKLSCPLIPTEEEKQNPEDSVSCIEWAPPQENSIYFFACASWDNKISFYDLGQDPFLNKIDTIETNAPIVSMSWKNDMKSLFLGAMDDCIRLYDLEKEQFQLIGVHPKPVLKVFWSELMKSVISVSIDGKLKIWDLRMKEVVASTEFGEKIHAVDIQEFTDTRYAVGAANKSIYVGSIQDAIKTGVFQGFPTGMTENSQYSAMGLAKQGGFLVAGTIDGNLLSSRINTQNNRLDNPVYKSVMMVEKDIYPVSDCGYFPNNELIYYTGKKIEFFDTRTQAIKKSIVSPSPITASKLSQDAKYLAFATGDDWSQGMYSKGKYPVELFVYTTEDVDSSLSQNTVKNPLGLGPSNIGNFFNSQQV